MDILQATMVKMGLSSKRLTTTFFVIIFIAFPIALTVTIMLQNSSFVFFERFSEDKVLGKEMAQNVTTELLRGSVQNITHDNSGGTDQNNNNNTMSQVSSKNASFTSSTNDSSSSSISIPNDKDKLLDGLLASGFDEASCISRLQSHLFRKASLHKPSPYLISKLRNYEELHRRCGPESSAYSRSMMKILSSKNNAAAATCKYLVWIPINGLGNQMISIVATFLYAVLTDRVLLIKSGKDKYGLFCEPFLNSTWILPKNFPFWNYKNIETYQSMLKKDKDYNSKEDFPSSLFLNLQHTKDDLDKFFHCDHSQDLLRNVPLLILKSDQYFVPSLSMNPSFNPEITKMFPEKDTVFYHSGRYLFHPSNEAWGLISSFYQEYLAKADERIALQIRVFTPDTTPQQAVMDLLLSCIIKNKLLPELDTQNSASYTGKNRTMKAVLVTSLYPEYGENLRTMYQNKSTVTGELIEVYQPSHEEHQKRHDKTHNMKAWTEMYLLSLCDVLVTTSVSTFGYVAQGLGGLKPWLLYKLTTNETHFPACERDFSLEPCYHYPPKHYCNGKPIKDFASSFPYLRGCKDFYYGVKLFNDSS
ncbi:hypothetical protein RIF29_38346 [Crotalaria pallida]|uniref:Fucosyltransferase n=1 Tax=Crotalaria pallida TaxID=3830 RepID=A0AAN9DZS0_CROPI